MGYTTEFWGEIKFNKPIASELKKYINKFGDIRHVKRDITKIKKVYPNWKELCYHEELGQEGQFFIGGGDGHWNDASIVDFNEPPVLIPSLYCQWALNENDELVWNGSEKFYSYTKWLAYLLYYFFEPNGYFGKGEIEYRGEDWVSDWGTIYVANNTVSVAHMENEPYFVYPDILSAKDEKER